MTIVSAAIAATPTVHATRAAATPRKSGTPDSAFGQELQNFAKQESFGSLPLPRTAGPQGDSRPATVRVPPKKEGATNPTALPKPADGAAPMMVQPNPIELELPSVEDAPPPSSDQTLPAPPIAVDTPATLPEIKPDAAPKPRPAEARASNRANAEQQVAPAAPKQTAVAVRVQPTNRVINPAQELPAKRPGGTIAPDPDAAAEPAPAITMPAAVATAFAQNSSMATAPVSKGVPADLPSATTTELRTTHIESAPKPSEPLRALSIEVGSAATNDKVQVRVVQQAGELHVAVRTGDSELAHGLQQGLPELVGKLQDSGYRADGWKPTGAVAAPAQSADSQGASNQSAQRDAQSHPGWSQQQEGRQHQNQSNRPRWVEELESSLSGEKA